jgi:hypothetical protein
MNTVLNFLGLGNAADQVGDKGLDILVVHAGRALDKNIGGKVTEFLLDVSHALSDSGNDFREAESDLILGVVGEDVKEFESTHFGLGLHLGGHDLEEGGEGNLDSSGIKLIKDSRASGIGSITHTSVLQK